MIEFMDLVLIFAIVCIISLFCSVLIAFALHTLRNRDVQSLADEVYSIKQGMNGSIGRDKRAERAERMNDAMFKLGLGLKEGKKIEEIAPAVLAEYPDVAMDLVKKATKSGFKFWCYKASFSFK